MHHRLLTAPLYILGIKCLSAEWLFLVVVLTVLFLFVRSRLWLSCLRWLYVEVGLTEWTHMHDFFCMYQSEMTWNLRGNCATYARCSVLISVLFPNQHAVSQLWKGCVKPSWRRKCYGCDLQCFITVINTGLNDVKCSKASNTICIIHDPCVVILLLLSHLTFPPVIVLPVLGKLLLPQRWSRKTSFFGSSRETDEC